MMIVAIKEILAEGEGYQLEFRHEMDELMKHLRSRIKVSSDSFGDESKEYKNVHPILKIYESHQIWLLDSEYICMFYDGYINPITGSICLVFEYFNNGNLEDQIQLGVKPEECDIGAVAFVVLSALKEYHKRGIIHRNIKPSNILIGNDGKLKITDSFIMTQFDDVSSIQSFFSITYMSPELLRAEDITTSTDIWSLGILLIKYGTGVYPFSAKSPWMLAEEILNGPNMERTKCFSVDLRDFIVQCTRLNKDLRPSVENLLQHPFIQNYLSNQIKASKDPTCINNYEDIRNESCKNLDINVSLNTIIEDRLAKQLGNLFDSEKTQSLQAVSDNSLQQLSQQLNVEYDYLKPLYIKKVDSINNLLQQIHELAELETSSYNQR